MEWIKITPETEFEPDKDYLFFKDGVGTVLTYLTTSAVRWQEFYSIEEGRDFYLYQDFTHYCIITEPTT
jgi:hypothetical protein